MTRIVLPVARNVMHVARLDILQSVAKQRNANVLTRDDEGRNNTRARAYQLSEDSATGQQDYYAFTVGVSKPMVVKLI